MNRRLAAPAWTIRAIVSTKPDGRAAGAAARLRATALQPDRIDATLAAGRCDNDALVAHEEVSHTLGAIASWIRSQRMRAAWRA
ncbi:hypothetical protein WT27_17550 [Burkholderia territorii]|uniref:Uncharacterized protein n=1 Tax=Burkholderia territorii TaxID=1503055 RepID=A0A105UY33_9BURK|nr:hypothetical protein WT27_17550 [Burkholderia territorii]KVX36987.1 hypothetical protein WT31_04560 [Burkholderia territorii]